MELFNELKSDKSQDVTDFLTFIPIYRSTRRYKSLAALIKRYRHAIEGKTVMEAGAGRGIFSQLMAELGAKEVLAIERSKTLYALAKEGAENHPTIECHLSDVSNFETEKQVDLLFHEFYGPLVLDETMLALRKLRFEPGIILPDGGKLWAMPISEADILAKDKQYEPVWKDILQGALISDLISGIPFKPAWEVFDWDVHSEQTAFEFEIPEACDFIAFCGEITHEGKSVLNMWWTHNWPVIYTPVAGKKFSMRFKYIGGFTRVYFEWIA